MPSNAQLPPRYCSSSATLSRMWSSSSWVDHCPWPRGSVPHSRIRSIAHSRPPWSTSRISPSTTIAVREAPLLSRISPARASERSPWRSPRYSRASRRPRGGSSHRRPRLWPPGWPGRPGRRSSRFMDPFNLGDPARRFPSRRKRAPPGITASSTNPAGDAPIRSRSHPPRWRLAPISTISRGVTRAPIRTPGIGRRARPLLRERIVSLAVDTPCSEPASGAAPERLECAYVLSAITPCTTSNW